MSTANISKEYMSLIKKQIISGDINIYDVSVMSGESDIEEYFVQPCNACNNSYSVTKVYTLTAIGILIDNKELSLNDRIYINFKDLFKKNHDTKWEYVTVEDVISHKIGLSEDCLDIDNGIIDNYEYLEVLFDKKLAYHPGNHYCYTDAAYYLLSRIVTYISGDRLDAFLRNRVLNFLNTREIAWSICPQNYTIGATGMYTRASEIVKLGWCYLNGGLYNSSRLFSKEWADFVLDKGYELSPLKNGWYCKYGMNGQSIMICIQKRLSIAWHGYLKGNECADLADFICNIEI